MIDIPSFALELRIQRQLMLIENSLAEARLHSFAMDNEENSKIGAKRSHQCSICEKSFEHSGKLHRHMRIHTGERPHECNICGKSFIQSGQLVIHMRAHTGDRPYACNICEKAFTCSKQLKVHKRTHTKEKPYKCEICGKSFGYNHVLKLHQVAHFGEKIYKCTLCDTIFSKKKHLEVHIRNHDDPCMLPSIQSLQQPKPVPQATPTTTPPPAHQQSEKLLPSIESHIILPSINTVCPDIRMFKDQVTPQDLSTRGNKVPIIRRNPLYPVTENLVKTLLAQDLAEFGPPTPLMSPPLSPEIYGDCLVPSPYTAPLTPPLSATPSPPSTPLSMSSMSESSLPLRKRRHLVSDCSDSDDSLSSRSSVICFAK